MKILFFTFPAGHLVSDKEYDRLRHGFGKVGMELIRWHKDKGEFKGDYDIVMVKGWSHVYDDLPQTPKKPIVYYSIGGEWKVGEDLDKLNEPIRDLYLQSDYVVHVSQYCQENHYLLFDKFAREDWPNERVIIPAEEPKLPDTYRALEKGKLKLAITVYGADRPVKRVAQTEELCKEAGIELATAYGTVTDFSYYNDCDGYIHLSRKEGMPNTVLEAMAYGLPCIVTNYGGAQEAVGDTGIVIKTDPEDAPWNPADIEPVDKMLFSKAIADFYINHAALRLKVRERVRSELNDYVMASRFKEVFESLL